MESKDLNLSIEAVGSSGFILSSEQRAALQTSLVLLQNKQKFANVFFWGKIIGGREDYYIAQGFAKDYLSERRTLYRYSRPTLYILEIFDAFLRIPCFSRNDNSFRSHGGPSPPTLDESVAQNRR